MINRTNYEEYLLMYLDGELSSSEAGSVESFLEENPDLKEELALLQQAILQPDEHIEFTGKQSLYRKEEGISLGNYQQFFLLYIDNELSVSDRAAVETFVLQQPQLQEEFTLLKQTVLPVETIVFANKELLYKKEEKRRPVVISLRWASLAAAMMIGIVVLVMFNNNGGNSTVDDTVAVKPVEPKTNTTNPSTPGTQKTIPATEQNRLDNNTTVAGVNNTATNKTTVQPLNEQVKNNSVQPTEIANNYRPQEQQVVIPPVVENAVTTNATNPVAVSPTNATGDGEEKNVAVNSPSADNNNPYVQNTVYTDDLDDDKDKTVYVGAMQVNPDKVRGLFRKATRFLSSKVKSNDDNDSKGKVKVANLEMNKIK